MTPLMLAALVCAFVIVLAITSFRQESVGTGSSVQMMSTELNSLAAAAAAIQNTGTNAEYDNSAGGNLYFAADFELDVTFATGPTDQSVVACYILYKMDGTNYQDGGTAYQPVYSFVGNFVCHNVTTAQRIPLKDIPIDPYPFKLLVVNSTNQPFPASGSTIKMWPKRQKGI